MDIHDIYSDRRYRGGYIHSSHNRSTMKMEYRAQLPDGRVIQVTTQRKAEMAINSATGK